MESAAPGRTNALVAGVLFIVATAASLLSGPFLAPVTGSDNLTAAAHHQGQVATGVLLGYIAAFAAPGIAIALYPVLRKFGAGLALGAVGFRVIEGVLYAVGMTVLLSLSTLSGDFVDAGSPGGQTYAPLGRTMLAQYHWMGDTGMLMAFSIGGGLYYLAFYRSRLIPAWLSLWGLAGAALLMVAAVLVLFGAIGALSATQVVLALPIAVQEMVLAVWLIAKGFDRSAFTGGQD
ncbi:MAG TPA: DUF4386 domain-containing protein [Blastococcus sp.]|nr:DUF4386 domain-containing protein [Blastococcus sp.]